MLRVRPTICINCGTQTPETVIADRLIRHLPENVRFGGQLKIVECKRCSLRYLNPMPDLRDLGQIYDYDVYEDSTNNNPVLMEHFHAQLRSHARELKSVIEIGCGTGDFLAWLQARGLKVAGVEFADSANRIKYQGPLYVGRMEDVNVAETYDAVLLLNGIKHLSDPAAVLRKIRQMLNPEGILLLRHPNSDLFLFWPYRLLIEFPKYLLHRYLVFKGKKTGFTLLGFQNQHLFYFHRRIICQMLEETGFLVETFSTTSAPASEWCSPRPH